MQDIYLGERTNGFIHLTSDVDCLPADIVRFDKIVVVDDTHLMDRARTWEHRGFHVIVNTETVQYATGVKGNHCPVCFPDWPKDLLTSRGLNEPYEGEEEENDNTYLQEMEEEGTDYDSSNR